MGTCDAVPFVARVVVGAQVIVAALATVRFCFEKTCSVIGIAARPDHTLFILGAFNLLPCTLTRIARIRKCTRVFIGTRGPIRGWVKYAA